MPSPCDTRLSILLVDDHDGVRATTSAMLSDLGHQVMTASDGKEALGLLEQELAIDLLLTDYAMPLLSGSELVRRARDGRPGLPAILITGNADAVEEAEPGYGVLTLSKPFTPRQLQQAILSIGAAELESRVA
jgi:CheY-like chemotaxis protein